MSSRKHDKQTIRQWKKETEFKSFWDYYSEDQQKWRERKAAKRGDHNGRST